VSLLLALLKTKVKSLDFITIILNKININI